MEFTGPKKPVKVTIQLLSQVQPRLCKYSITTSYSVLHLLLIIFITFQLQDGLIKAIEGSGAQIQQKVIQYFNKLMEAPPRETEV